MVWFGLVLWQINHCRLFNDNSVLYINISYIWFVNISQQSKIVTSIVISCLNFWDEAWLFLSLKVFGLLSSSLFGNNNKDEDNSPKTPNDKKNVVMYH